MSEEYNCNTAKGESEWLQRFRSILSDLADLDFLDRKTLSEHVRIAGDEGSEYLVRAVAILKREVSELRDQVDSEGGNVPTTEDLALRSREPEIEASEEVLVEALDSLKHEMVVLRDQLSNLSEGEKK